MDKDFYMPVPNGGAKDDGFYMPLPEGAGHCVKMPHAPTMLNNYTTEQLLNICGHAYDAACYHHAKHDAEYEESLARLMTIVDELMRRARNGNAQ